jgi:hypothetical protein
MSAASLVAAVTFFESEAATTKTEENCSIGALAARILAATAPAKSALPWLKLARFGNHRSGKGSLRNNRNVLCCTGCEADYDAGKVAFQAVVDCLRKAGIAAIVYTSPSYTRAFPKYRVLCLFSRELPPERRAIMLARLAGVLATIGVEIARESRTLSQSYYFGAVNNNPAHQVIHIDGTPIDLRDDLDAIAIHPPTPPKPNGSARPVAHSRAPPKPLADRPRNG